MMMIAARLANVVLGIWLMAAPAVLGFGEAASTNARIVGPLVATLAIVAMWPATSPLRHGNAVLGCWIVVAPWLIGVASPIAIAHEAVVGLAVLAASRVGGGSDRPLGGGWRELVGG